MKTKVLLLVLIILQGCISKPSKLRQEPPCYDGWATGGEVGSILWVPSAAEFDELSKLIPQERTIHCWHEMPNGSYAAITSGPHGDYYQSNYHKSGLEFFRGVEYELITVH